MDSGIYKIANIKTGDFYIGSAVKFNLRFNRHKFDLKNQKHYNKMLQNIYNKYRLGHKASKETKIKMSESQKGNKNGLGHKHSTEIRHKISETKTGGKSFKIKSPIGDIYENKYLNEFCSMHNLHPSHLREVINGRRPHHKGWTKC